MDLALSGSAEDRFDAGYPKSWYAATAHAAPERPPLAGKAETDVCIVGAGYSGLSAAIELLERGFEVRVLEAARVGWGASGRNGGQVVNGLNASLESIEARFGRPAAQRIGALLTEGASIIFERIERHRIDCDAVRGNLFVALNARHMRGFENKLRLWEAHGVRGLELVHGSALGRHVVSDAYVGGLLDHGGGHLHPLNLALGEAAVVEALGGRIHEHSAVVDADVMAPRPLVRTRDASLRCRVLLLCGNAYLGRAVPVLANRVMPVSTQMMATAPLGEARIRGLLPSNVCVEDARYVLDYFRASADHRLLFGGGTVYGGQHPADVIAKLRPNMLEVFPSLNGVPIEFTWNGHFALSFSRVPQLGRLGASCYFAHGYSGHGVTGSHLFGRILAEAVAGDLGRFDVFAGLPYLPFPGGRALRVPYSVLGSWWYRLRDATGV